MKKVLIIISLAALQCACAGTPAAPPKTALLTFDELAGEISVARVEHRKPAGRDDQGPFGTP